MSYYDYLLPLLLRSSVVLIVDKDITTAPSFAYSIASRHVSRLVRRIKKVVKLQTITRLRRTLGFQCLAVTRLSDSSALRTRAALMHQSAGNEHDADIANSHSQHEKTRQPSDLVP